jgi:ribosome biogenesis GTPase
MTPPPNTGTVIRQYLGHYYVSAEGQVYECGVSSRLRKDLEYPESGSRRRRVARVKKTSVIDPVAIGDRVMIESSPDGKGFITEVLQRSNKISRRASGKSGREQVIAANVDQVIPIFALADPNPIWPLLDRMLAIAEWQEVPAAICFNKTDLPAGDDAEEVIADFERIGYPVVRTSVVADNGKESVRQLLKDKTSLFMGPSGVGKSSLVNWVQPGLSLRTGEVSETTGEGKHITTHTELHALSFGGWVGDIPGVREFHLRDVDAEDMPFLFREFRGAVGNCRFRDCAHVMEPGCQVKLAVEEGRISQRRYDSFVRLRADP